jgi:holo-[acyl-carrier protein] synthase
LCDTLPDKPDDRNGRYKVICGIGTDILDIKRLQPLDGKWDDPFFMRTFTEDERNEALRQSSPITYFAGRFAAKEAVLKALHGPKGAVEFSQIEVLYDEDKRPTAKLIDAREIANSNPHIHISISHERSTTIAVAIVEA